MSRRSAAAGLEAFAVRALWPVIAVLFLGIGLQKLTAYEAFAVAPIARTSPFLAWIYDLAGVRNASRVFAAIEVLIGGGLLMGFVRPGHIAAKLASVGAAVTAFITFAFLFTAPGVLVKERGLTLLSLEVGQLFLKDLVLLTACLVLVGQSWRSR
ncbi:DUF417 family protein [Phenylobacterium deserti]|uniref:DUF417 family protein n=1 Tax=Phenylobacterium deserti TaxID=1914756 RepID=UPI001403E88E|nr:DUF417 family protein [Phenylobacterium deserti]